MSTINKTAFKSTLLKGTIVASLILGAVGGASAQTTFDVIGPHEYELPVGFDPFNVFVQYATVQKNDETFNSNGDRVKGNGTTTTVGMSKYVRFWTLESNPSIGMAYEVIVPEIGVMNRRAGTNTSGFGDPLTGFAIWYKPTSTSTFGFQSFLQIPVGDHAVSDNNWKNLSSFLWDVRVTDEWGWTADAGFVFQGVKADGTHPGTSFHTNQRLGYRASKLVEPFVALDYERAGSSSTVASSKVLDAGVGAVLHTFDNQSITLRYSQSLNGQNHSSNNSFNVKYAYVW